LTVGRPETATARPAGQSVHRVDAVIVAAGAGRRMNGRDKLSTPIGGRPLLAWTIDALAASPEVERIVVVTTQDQIVGLAAAEWLNPAVVAVVAGGRRRQESVFAGVAALEAADERIVLVHDGARPAVRPALVSAVAAAATAHGAAIPALGIAETVKRLEDGRVVETLDRATLAVAQTPQAARAELLRAAWQQFPPGDARTFTDEAALLEAARIPVHAIAGDPTNIKVTVPDDIDRAAELLLGGSDRAGTTRGGTPRVGFGSDGHPFGPGRPLWLGGIEIPGAPRLHGHSDGDVAIHAVADALLGAAGLGDLGSVFPAGPGTPRGIAGSELLTGVLDRVRASGHEPRSVDVTIVGARPRLAGRLDAMREALAALLDLSPDRVDVKASTGNLDGMEGAGRGITAHAVAVLERTSRGSAGT
jgi:2-C-methyl-D-erythritol 4-phosphate cytidylyltransferase/2-C-methyl-D-erythritol 2,4-cyclodiphosphate synthase